MFVAILIAASAWVRAQPEESGLDPGKLQAMEAAAAQGQFPKLGSVLVARHGKLAYEKYFDGGAATLRDTRSATKSITSALVGIAVRDKKLKLDTRVLSLLPARARKLQNPDPRKQRITVEDLLTMGGPLECDDWNEYSRGNEERMYLVEDWAQFILDLPIAGRSRLGGEPPATHTFSYCTGGVFVLGEVLEKATGLRADAFAAKELFGPLGIDRVQWVYSPLGEPGTGGGLRLTSLDLLKLGQLYLDKGAWNGKRILEESWVAASTQAHQRTDKDTEYGFLFWLRRFGTTPAVYMSGNGGNKVVIVPSLDLVAVITSQNYGAKGMHQVTEKLLTDFILPAAP